MEYVRLRRFCVVELVDPGLGIVPTEDESAVGTDNRQRGAFIIALLVESLRRLFVDLRVLVEQVHSQGRLSVDLRHDIQKEVSVQMLRLDYARAAEDECLSEVLDLLLPERNEVIVEECLLELQERLTDVTAVQNVHVGGLDFEVEVAADFIDLLF